jgi:hypothetical protein
VVDQKGNHRAIKVVCKSNIRTKKNKTKVSKRYTGLLFPEGEVCSTNGGMSSCGQRSSCIKCSNTLTLSDLMIASRMRRMSTWS